MWTGTPSKRPSNPHRPAPLSPSPASPPLTVTLSGATGLIGKALAAALRAQGHFVRSLGRSASPPNGWRWDALSQLPPAAALAGADAVIHLSGEPISHRWTSARWQRIVASRVDGTRRMVEAMAALDRPPPVLISASGIGIYGDRGDEILTETSGLGLDRVARLCMDWEREALRAEALGCRVVLLRTGLVLSPAGGALARMLPAFRCGLGGPLGTGRQWQSWIHLRDLVRLIEFALAEPAVRGPLNGTAPEPVTNREFARGLADVLRRPAFLPVPRPALRLMFGAMADILTASQRVLPETAARHGFRHEFPSLGPALADLLGG